MKNKLLKLFTLTLTLCTVLFTFTACQEPHVHNYDKQVATEEYLASAAACEQKPTYYLSCACGEKGTETFEFGDALEHSFTNYVSDNNASYEKDGTKTASCDNGCGATDTINDDNTKLDSKITFKTLAVDGKNASATLSNATEEFSFAEEIEIIGIVKFEVSLDKYGSQIFLTKIVPLNVGDNTFYIFVLNGEDIVDTYTVNIRRRPNYTVTFNVNGGTAVDNQTVEEGFTATKPADIEKAGYTFDGWDFDFNTAITENKTVNAKWTANTNTPYKVEYYLQNLNDNNYTLEDTENLTGTTDTTANAVIKTFEHFTAEQSSVSGNIADDGSTVLKVYYTRNYYQVTVQKENDNGTVTGGGKYANAQSVTVKATVNTGYDFDGWYVGTEKVSSDLEYIFNPIENVTLIAKWTIKTEMQPFNFTSTTTTCTITGIKDKTVTNIIIPDYVTSIGYEAFSGCSSLQSITIPDSVSSIGYSAFSNCSSLQYNIKDGLNYLGNEENKYLCLISPVSSSIVTANIDNNCKVIANSAFYYCTSLQSITIGNSVTSIGNYAFEDCTSLQSIVIPDSVTSIGNYAFYNCTSLQSIIIPDSVTSIGNYAFRGCSSLQSITVSSDNTKYHSKDNCLIETTTNTLVLGCKNSIIPNYVTSIGNYAFYGCSSLQSITIGNSVTSIGNSAFRWCTSLQSITIPDSVTSIGNYAFEDCTSLQSITVSSDNTKYHSKDNCLIETTTNTLVLGCKNSIIPNYVTSIGDWAFYGCSSLQSITIPNSVTSIGEDAFYYCKSLQSIVIPDSVTSIGDYAFSWCSNLTIYCEAVSKPAGWSSSWNYSNRPVVWGI